MITLSLFTSPKVVHFKEINVLVVCAICLCDINYGKERVHLRVGQIEVDLDRGLHRSRLKFV